MQHVKKTLRDSAAMRWLVLILISGFMFSTYWFYDFFSGLKQLMETQLGVSSSDYGMLISSTTWANLAGMIIIGGIILDKWGIRIAGVLFGTVTTVGAALVALGAGQFLSKDPTTNLWIMIAGRVLFGSGIEALCVIITRTVVKWFKGYELALAMAINVGFGRVGSALAVALSIDIGDGAVAPASNFSFGLIAVAFLMFMIYLIFDVKIDRQLEEGAPPAGDDEKFRLSDLTKLATDRTFIFIALLCVAFYSAVFPFMQYAPDLLVNKFGFSSTLPDMSAMSLWEKIQVYITNGPKVASLIPLGTILFTPIFGSIVDKRGKAATLMILGSGLLIFAHISLSVFNVVWLGYLGLLSLGVAFSLVPAAMWPSVAKIVPEHRLGTAYASMFTVQNWGLAAFFWGIGKVLDMSNADRLEGIRAGTEVYDYTVPISMLVVLGIVSIFLAFMLKRADKKQGYGLEQPSSQQSDHQKRVEADRAAATSEGA